MKRLFLVLFLLLFLAVPALSTVYSVGSGETYTTLTAVFAAIDSDPGDVFKLTSNISDNLTWNAQNEGDASDTVAVYLAGHTIDASGGDYAFYLNGRDYCKITGPGTITGSLSHGIFALGSDNLTISNLLIATFGQAGGNYDGIRIINDSLDFLIDSVEITGGIGLVPDGIDISSGVGLPISGKINNCYIHDITGATYAQGVKFPGDDKTTDIIEIINTRFKNINGYGVVVGEQGKTTIAHCVFDNIERYGYYSTAAGTSSGRETYLYNNIFNGPSQVHISVDNRYEDYTGNYNILKDDVSSGLFRDVENSLSMGIDDWRTLQPGQDTNTLVAGPYITDSGKLYLQSPGINEGKILVGINDGDELDPWGHFIHEYPNIGAYQGRGVQGAGMAYPIAWNVVRDVVTDVVIGSVTPFVGISYHHIINSSFVDVKNSWGGQVYAKD